MNKDEILLDILRTGRRWHEGKMTLEKAEAIIEENINSYNAVKNLDIQRVMPRYSNLIECLKDPAFVEQNKATIRELKRLLFDSE